MLSSGSDGSLILPSVCMGKVVLEERERERGREGGREGGREEEEGERTCCVCVGNHCARKPCSGPAQGSSEDTTAAI